MDRGANSARACVNSEIANQGNIGKRTAAQGMRSFRDSGVQRCKNQGRLGPIYGGVGSKRDVMILGLPVDTRTPS